MSRSKKRRERREARRRQREHELQAELVAAVAGSAPPSPATPGAGAHAAHPNPSLDARLERKALRQRWPIKEEYRQPLIDRQVRIAVDPNTTSKEATLAFRAILTADLANMEQEKREAAEGEEGGSVTQITNISQTNVFSWEAMTRRQPVADAIEERIVALEAKAPPSTNGTSTNGQHG